MTSLKLNYTDSICSSIPLNNITFLQSKFGGLPEFLLINAIACTVILMIFCILRAISWNQQNKHDSIYKNGWITLFYRDALDLIPNSELERMRSVYTPLDPNMTYFQMLKYSFFQLTNAEIQARCGVDALQYLRFLKCSAGFFAIDSFVVLVCILPANYLGTIHLASNLFRRTTMGNIDFANSNILWIHVTASLFLTAFCFYKIWSFSSSLVVYKLRHWTSKTVLLKETSHKPITVERIEKYISDIMPDAEVEDIRLVFKYRKLILQNERLIAAEEALEICRHIYNVENRRVFVRTRSWCLSWLNHMEDGITYYSKEVLRYRRLVAKEMNRVARKTLRVAYVTFRDEHSAQEARSRKKTPELVKDDIHWEVQKASDPDNVLWENLNRRGFTCRTLFINTAVLLVAFFLTTPTIILSSTRLGELGSMNNKLQNKGMIVRFLPTLIVWLLSVAVPALVTYSSGFLNFHTKALLNKSIMRKTVTFLTFTVAILPSLGLASISAFFEWTLKETDTDIKWGCIFLPDNGIFFVSYVMTSAFIGNVIQVLRLAEVFFCAFGKFTAASAEAEKITIKKSLIWDFSFGVQYAYSLLIFTLVLFFSLMCPVIAPFGLIYFLTKLLVDRYNLCFGCRPSRHSADVHALAIHFMMLAVALSTVGLFFLMYIRGGWITVTYVAHALMWLTLVFYFFTQNPCCLKLPKIFLMPHKVTEKTTITETVATAREIYFPLALMKYADVISPKDKYGNPVLSEESLLRSDDDSPTCVDTFCIND